MQWLAVFLQCNLLFLTTFGILSFYFFVLASVFPRMRSGIAFCLVLLAITMAEGLEFQNRQNALDPSMAMLEAAVDETSQALSELDFLRVPFDPATNAKDQQSKLLLGPCMHFRLLALRRNTRLST